MNNLFGGSILYLSENENKLIKTAGPTVIYPPGQLVFAAGEIADRVYFMEKGIVKIFKLTTCGNYCTVALRFPGDFIGLAEVLYGGRRSCYAEVMEEAHMTIIQKTVLENMLMQHPDIAVKVAQILGARLREAQSKLFEMACYQVPSRLALLLLKTSERLGEKTDEGIKLKVKFTHEEMAYMVGTSRPSVTVALKMFEKEKSIKRTKSGEIIITCAETLKKWI
ncbi:Crp/Fnr family transcriptional regulator [Calderihabitans maritimus]|uniref:Crp/Fnr family transcriptional regulator n=1 Tax=Calderihabitans maritimus TaxID=1246530 RepID=A0A1Z5HQF5_9FIRM|nr:Crp/Fnr family transcriptional regulator [Calderihabitans maritimus]GAW91744.1 Crp/Fnr family transcriptional regulator [Calderihabitans maritimus]